MIQKFRAWDKMEKTMHYDVQDVYDGMCGTVQASCFGQLLEEKMQDENFHEIPGTRRYNVMQFTGMTDKNKSELYDKDILRISNEAFELSPRIAVVTWDRTGQWVFDFGDDEPISAPDIFTDLSDAGIDELYCFMDIEKIGNIFENEDLLNIRLKEKYPGIKLNAESNFS